MELKLIGHEDRYAVEQLMLSLFPEGTEGTAQSRLSRGETWLTVTTDITSGGKSVRCVRRMRAAQETVRLRRQLLQQCFYQAAVGLLPREPAWGALAGVRPTKITTKHLLEGGTAASARKLLQETYYVSPLRSQLAVSCSESTVKAVANALAPEGLRILEVRKEQLRDIPAILDQLTQNPLKFVIFIDDLSFSADDDNFAALKAIL